MTMKAKTIFRCQECGFSSGKWLGKCPDCGTWNTFSEEKQIEKSDKARRTLTDFTGDASPLDEISSENFSRTATEISEFDRILGGGVVAGSLVLLGGPPGIGKSTIMLQVSKALASNGKSLLYISGEESMGQIKNRADRLNIKSKNLYLLSETNLENIIEAINKIKPGYVVLDSIQTTYRSDIAGAPGTVSQVRECSAELLKLAKSRGVSVFILGHVTKEGDLAGPRVLEHIVDTVLYFESEKQQVYRILRVNKNRFGPTSEIGVFEMKSDGLKEVKNPSSLFLSEQMSGIAGSAISPTIEGTRPILVEIQSLVTKANFGVPRRQANGIDYNRMVLLIAVLERRLGFHLEFQDVYVNVVGGIKIKETAVDLATAAAVAGAYSNFVIPEKLIIIGEVGLSGEIRAVGQIDERLKESENLGFKKAVIPKNNTKALNYKGKMEILPVISLQEAVGILKGK